MKQKVLQICKKSPFPVRDGESVAIHQLTNVLCTKYEVTVLAMTTPKHALGKDFESEKNQEANYIFCEVNTDISFVAAFFNLFSRKPYITERFFDKRFENQLKQLLQKQNFDFVHLEGVFLADYIPVIRKFSSAKIILRAHNVEHLIWERMARNQTNLLKKIYLNQVMIPRLKAFEINATERVDAILPISPVDELFFREVSTQNQISTIPVGYGNFPQGQNYKPNTIGYLGALDWLPNIEGLQWFLDNVWLQFYEKFPNVVFNIAGRNMNKTVAAWKYPGVNLVGEVENAAAFISSNYLMVVPLLSGSGMRIKVIEAMALKKCIVSTFVGAEGIEVENGTNIFLSNKTSEWVEILSDLIENEDKANKTAQCAADLIKSKYHIDVIGKKMLQFYEQIA
jgi:polysaccharide biosynthesis protein PslH